MQDFVQELQSSVDIAKGELKKILLIHKRVREFFYHGLGTFFFVNFRLCFNNDKVDIGTLVEHVNLSFVQL